MTPRSEEWAAGIRLVIRETGKVIRLPEPPTRQIWPVFMPLVGSVVVLAVALVLLVR